MQSPLEQTSKAGARVRSRGTRGPVQLDLEFKAHGGPRKGAGRKPAGRRPRVSHAERPAHQAWRPLIVTMRLRDGLPSLRRPEALTLVLAALGEAAESQERFRVVVFALQSNHIHLVVEAQDEVALTRGMQGLSVRIARTLNRVWSRRGPVFADRYHARALGTPREVRIALVYVLHNARKHGVLFSDGVDPYTSGRWFQGWELPARSAQVSESRASARPGASGACHASIPVATPRTWLLSQGWLRFGRIRIDEAPAGPRRAGRGTNLP
jgi:putative transposase